MKPTAEWEMEAWDEDLDKDSHRHYRKIVGMLRWLVAETPDIMFDVKTSRRTWNLRSIDTGNRSSE